jgi:uncharacterized cupredoxin-like copper-binding protein
LNQFIQFRRDQIGSVRRADRRSDAIIPFAAHARAGRDPEMAPVGEPGIPNKNVKRTIAIEMHDNYFEPRSITIAPAETVRFTIANKGALLHEFNIGTPAMHDKHQKEMQTMLDHGMITPTKINESTMSMDMPGMEMHRAYPNAVLIEPGKLAQILWEFGPDATLELACDVPGHYEAGMVGKINHPQ